jgi:ATP-binding protein involved in chromosome partitioning
VPLLGQIPIVQSIREGGDDGRPVMMDETPIVSEAFKNAAEALARQVAIRNASGEKTVRVEVR